MTKQAAHRRDNHKQICFNGQSNNRHIYLSFESEKKMNKHMKKTLAAIAILAAAASASAFAGDVQPFGKKAAVPANTVPNGLVQAPGPSLVYFSDASYPVQPQAAEKQTRAQVKAEIIQADKKAGDLY